MTTRKETPNILDDLMSAAPAGATQPAASPLRIADIRRDGGTQPRAGLDEAHVQDLIQAIAEEVQLPPVDVVFDGTQYWLYDGFHRVEAHMRTGRFTVLANIHQGTQVDAQWMSYSVNRGHGLKRTNEDKKRAVLAALRHANAASLSNVQIAKHCGVDEGTVRNYRNSMESSSEIPKMAERTVTRGSQTYTQNTAGQREAAQRRQKRDDAAEDTWQPAQQTPDVIEPAKMWQLEWAVSQAIRAFYRDEAELRTAWSDMRASAKIMGGGFWLEAMKVCDNYRFMFDASDLVKAINSVANQRERQEQISEAARLAKAGRPLMEVLKTADELAAEAEAADIASRNAAADEAERQAAADPYDHAHGDAIMNDLAAREAAHVAEAQRQIDEGRRVYDAAIQAAVLTPDVDAETAATARNTKIDFLMYRLQGALDILADYEQVTGIYVHSPAIRRVISEMLAKLEGNKV